MNLVCIPYHDWRKIESEGSRTRDSHIIQHLSVHPSVDNILVINRPITYTEILLKKKRIALTGEVLLSNSNFKLYKVSPNLFVLDYLSLDFIGPLLKRKKWFIDSYRFNGLYEAYIEASKFLQIEFDLLFSQNIFSSGFASKFPKHVVFDAWDNFLLFPEHASIHDEIKKSYIEYSEIASLWTTNSYKNVSFYNEHYKLKECLLIKNGVDYEVFQRKYEIPDDLKSISQPIAGFGGKITHLFNYEFFNYTVDANPDVNFVIVGQILDKDVFSKISKSKNVFYLGDKPYKKYHSYVTNFNIGIVPYVTNNLEHGADSIKVYEYIASGLSVVGTGGAGMNELSDYILVSSSKEDFSNNIRKAVDNLHKPKEQKSLPDHHSWKAKTDELIKRFLSL